MILDVRASTCTSRAIRANAETNHHLMTNIDRRRVGRRRRARDVERRGDDGENVDEWTWKDVATRVSSGGDDDRGITRKKDVVDDDSDFELRRHGRWRGMFRWNLARIRRGGRWVRRW